MKINNAKLEFSNDMSTRKVTDTLCLHHTGVSQKQSVDVIHSYHRYTNGWAGIGYHYYVRKDGTVWQGRPDDKQGAHCPKVNANSVAVCFEGNFENDRMSDEQLKAGREIIAYIMKKYPAIKKIVRHKDVASTVCPGKNFPFDELKKYNADIENNTAADTKTKSETVKSFKVKILDDALNIRKSAGISSEITGIIKDHGVYTITETKGTVGKSGSWGKLKSGAGWISLYSGYVKKL